MVNLVISKEKILVWVSIISMILITAIYLLSAGRFEKQVFSTKYEIKNTDKERRKFIESFNIKLKGTKCIKESVLIPLEFDEILNEYEKIQNEMGLSLSTVKGQRVLKYTYEVDCADSVLYANIFVYGKYIVACDILNPDFKNGFLKSFSDYIR